jgi:hypothetical protein
MENEGGDPGVSAIKMMRMINEDDVMEHLNMSWL